MVLHCFNTVHQLSKSLLISGHGRQWSASCFSFCNTFFLLTELVPVQCYSASRCRFTLLLAVAGRKLLEINHKPCRSLAQCRHTHTHTRTHRVGGGGVRQDYLVSGLLSGCRKQRIRTCRAKALAPWEEDVPTVTPSPSKFAKGKICRVPDRQIGAARKFAGRAWGKMGRGLSDEYPSCWKNVTICLRRNLPASSALYA